MTLRFELDDDGNYTMDNKPVIWRGRETKSLLSEGSRILNAAEGDFSDVLYRDEEIKEQLSCPEDVQSTLKGAAIINSNLSIIENHNIVIRSDHQTMTDKVKLVTGGKLGHEPLYLSYVARGLLTGAILGSKDEAPPAGEIYICLKQLSHNHNKGIIAIVPNSFEEVINFGLAMEKVRCEGVTVDMVTVGDDCWESQKTKYGKRCLAGIVFAFKIAGAMAESSYNMKDIYLMLRKLRIETISCHIYGNKPFIGTSLESGTGKLVETENFCAVISEMLNYIVDPKKYFSLDVNQNPSFLLMVNSYTTERLFLYACVKEVLEQLQFRKINIVRVYAGTFVAGIKGFSITLLKENDEKLVNLTDSSCSCDFWPKTKGRGVPLVVKGPRLPPGPPPLEPVGPIQENTNYIDVPIMYACNALYSAKNALNKLDPNGNFGNNISPVLDVLLAKCFENELNHDRPYNLLNIISYICQDYIPSIHGTLFYIFFHGASQAFLSYSIESPVEAHMWVEACERGIHSIKAYTRIEERDLSILDVLSPFIATLSHCMNKKDYTDEEMMDVLDKGVEVAQKMLEDTHSIESPKKKSGLPEVSGQAALVALMSVVEGIRVVLNRLYGK